MIQSSLIEKFIYSCSHDLRAPVSSIQGLVRIAEYYPHHDETHKCLEMIESCTHTMNKVISTMQEYLTNNQRPLSFTHVEIVKFIEEIEDRFKNQLDTSNIKLRYDIKPLSRWHTDFYNVSKILEHLICNAIAFHDPQKEERKITVKIETSPTGSTVEVADNGLGIPEAEAKKLFEIFHRGSENTLGIGMGLFLTKSIVDRMGGIISCKSVLTEGTVITVSFPENRPESDPR